MNVSVIIPSYNAEKTLADTLRCLQLQTFTEWEAIVIDDGSQDNTAVIAQTFAEKDERIRLITQPNGGVSAARNHGLRVAQNDFLLFLDADDWISSDHLEEMTNALKVDTTLDAVQCGSMYVMPSGALVDNSYFIDDAQLFNTFARTCVFCIHACVIRRTLVLDLGGFDDTLVTCEDWDLWQRAARTGARFGKVQKVMSMYRMRPGSASENGFRMLPDGLKVIGRGHGSDPRVKNPAPEFANGRSPQNLDNAILSHICWTAGLAIGKGKNPLPMFELVRDYHAPMLDPHEAASALFEAVLLPTCQTRDGWLHLWPKLKNNIIQFFDALEAQSRADGFSARAQNMLEQLIIHHAVKQHHPITIGRTHGVTIDVSQAIRDVAAPSSAERLFVLVTIEGDYLGTLMLPLFDRFMSNHVLIDAIANKFSWSILERFFWHTIYYKLRGEETSDGVKLWRDDTLLAQGLPEDYYGHIHGYAGWTLFLQELWRRPFWIDSQFYDATIVDALAETLFVENGQVTIEVSEPIPNIEAYVEEVKIAVQVAGAFVGFVSIPVKDDLVTAQAIRTAITETCSLELSRVAVREGLIGQPFDDHGSLQTRLHSTSVTIRGNQPVIEPGTLPRSAPATARIFDEIQAQREQIWAVGRYAHGEIGTAVSRRATLPTSVAELVKTAVDTQTVTPIPTTNNRPPQTIIYLPEWHPGEQYSQENAEPDYDPNNWGNHFENVFHQQRDPWKYTCPYEQIKFAQTLSLLPAKSFDNVLEIGCAEGHFTTQLAPYAKTLLATDISDEALIHASERCAGLEHVSFQEMDLRNGTLPESCDLIVCSEMLYFMDNELTMKQVAAKIAGALTVGGYLLTAHANLTVDDPNSSGFSWEHPFGGKRIGEIFAHTTGLQMVKEIQTPLYRVQLFKRQIPKRFQLRAAKPEIIKYDYQSTVLPAHVSQYAVWQGTDQFNRPPENTNRLPILMYHRVAPTGDALSRYRVTPQAFEDQLRYLRESGYYTVDFDTWQTAAKNKTPLPGKAICLTFDDGYLDFYTYAFPLLKKYNFTATVFIVTECVGQTNAWDAVYGEEVPLMNWEQILELQAQGIDLGSHTANHPHLTALSPTEIVKQAISSRATLSEKLNKPIMSIAYPYGDMDELVQHLIGAAGYVHAVTTYHAFCEFSNDLIAMPRLEVKGDDTIADFAAILNPTLPST